MPVCEAPDVVGQSQGVSIDAAIFYTDAESERDHPHPSLGLREGVDHDTTTTSVRINSDFPGQGARMRTMPRKSFRSLCNALYPKNEDVLVVEACQRQTQNIWSDRAQVVLPMFTLSP